MPSTHLSGTSVPIDGRLRLGGVLIVLVFGVFFLRLFQLQILEGDSLRERSERNSVRTVRLEAPRGEILDREGRVLATTRPAYELQVIPNDLRRPERTYAALAQLLETEAEELAERVGTRRRSERFKPVALRDDLPFDQLAKVETHRYALQGVVTSVQPRRHYVEGELGAHLLGSIGEVRADQLEKERFATYRAGEVIGQTGLESRLERHLRGRTGGRNVVVDAAGREVDVLDEVPSVPGGKVVLALDLDLQAAAEAAFLNVPEGQPPMMGAVAVLDVRTGDVLALASRPTYDPNSFAGGIDSATWKQLITDEWEPLQNRVIQNHYPPGSIHKPIVAAGLLADGVVTPETRVFCPGFFRHGGRIYRCWKRGGHGSVDLMDALKRSCDVYFYTFGTQLGIDRIAHYARSFGLGGRTGIGLPGEATGLVPSSDWKKRRFKQVWFPGETVSASIGQGYNLYTPLQLAVAYAALANGGKVMRPRLVLRLESQEGRVLETTPPEVKGRVDVAPEYLALVRKGLTAVVEETGGTGGRARVPGVVVAGKTGTAQVVGLKRTEGMKEEDIPIRYRDHGWFGAFAPADDPEIAVGVFVEHGLHGSSAAAPIAQAVMNRYFEKQGVLPDEQVAAGAGARRAGD